MSRVDRNAGTGGVFRAGGTTAVVSVRPDAHTAATGAHQRGSIFERTRMMCAGVPVATVMRAVALRNQLAACAATDGTGSPADAPQQVVFKLSRVGRATTVRPFACAARCCAACRC